MPRPQVSDGSEHEYARSDVARLVRTLRRDILACEPETRFGLEEALVKRYGVSRPTLRQAVRVLEHEKLITVRRGSAGGYYARRPSDHDMVQAAALSLQVNGCTMPQAIVAGMALLRAVAKAATTSSDQAARDELRSYTKEYEAFDYKNHPLADFLEAETAMARRINNLAKNSALLFFNNILFEFGVRRVGLRSYDERPERMAAEIQITAKIAYAICDGDIEIAEIFTSRKEEMLLGWLSEDLEAREQGDARQPQAQA